MLGKCVPESSERPTDARLCYFADDSARTNFAERRESSRHRAVMRAARLSRLTIDRLILLRYGSQLVDAHLCDMSQRGAKIRFPVYLATDSRVQISHDVLRPVGGSIKWQAGNLIGIEFHRTLAIDELTCWSEQSQ